MYRRRYNQPPLNGNGLGQLYEVKTPSGVTVSLTPEEEREIVKEAIRQRIIYRMNRSQKIEEAAISSIGTAIGLALGGLLIGWLLGRTAK